jgi:F0F1-type ATP synthase membrane subunit b/b'
VDFVVAVNNFGDTRSGGLAGPMGLFIIVLMCVAVVMLIRNMNKRLRRLPDSFPDAEAARREAEIAKLDADLDQPDAEPHRARIDESRSASSMDGADAEVSDVDIEKRPSGSDAGTERA